MSYVTEMSPADIRACTCGGNDGNGNNGNGMFGNDWAWIIILLLFGYGGRGFGGNGGFGGGNSEPIIIDAGRSGGSCGCGCSPCATQADLAAGFNNSAVLSNLNDLKLGQASVQQTLCQGFNGVNTAILQTANGIDNAICTLGYQTQQVGNAIQHQISDCCCDTRAAIKDVGTGIERTGWNISKQISDCCCDLEKANMQNRFDAQAYNCNTLQAIDKLGDRIIDYMANEKTQALRDEVQALRLRASQSEQNGILRAAIDASTAEIIRRTGNDCPVPAYVVNGPTPVNFPTNCCGQVQFGGNCGCGCGSY